jgi:2-dehydro-3-deoxyglucarate aldolase/4-hydroxy-2-oxoheptanedioate aldolase
VTPDTLSYFREANQNTTVICQIESTGGLANLDAIAGTQGVDVLWVGQFDLTQSMGIPGEFQNSRFLDALRAVVGAAQKHGKAAGIQPGNLEQAEQWLKIGFNVISWGNDISVYRGALASGVRTLRDRIAGLH